MAIPQITIPSINTNNNVTYFNSYPFFPGRKTWWKSIPKKVRFYTILFLSAYTIILFGFLEVDLKCTLLKTQFAQSFKKIQINLYMFVLSLLIAFCHINPFVHQIVLKSPTCSVVISDLIINKSFVFDFLAYFRLSVSDLISSLFIQLCLIAVWK